MREVGRGEGVGADSHAGGPTGRLVAVINARGRERRGGRRIVVVERVSEGLPDGVENHGVGRRTDVFGGNGALNRHRYRCRP